MNQEQKSLRIGAAVIACTVVLRLAGSGALEPLVKTMSRPEVASFLLYLETGRVVRRYTEQPRPNWEIESPAPDFPPPELPQPDPVIFRNSDLDNLKIDNTSHYEPDWEALLAEELDWNLVSEEPTVLIYHTHTTESYTMEREAEYVQTAAYRTLDESYNVVAVGEAVAQKLEEEGIQVIHDRTVHDYPSYNEAYDQARVTLTDLMARYPSVKVVLDIHRDAADLDNGGQLATFAPFNGRETAKLMVVVGTDAGGLEHAQWEKNLSLALKLNVILEKQNPGICRSMCLRSSRYNQDVSPGALLIEVGASGDTRTQALAAAEALAEGLAALSGGTIKNSTS